jgi:hypothetical protein
MVLATNRIRHPSTRDGYQDRMGLDMSVAMSLGAVHYKYVCHIFFLFSSYLLLADIQLFSSQSQHIQGTLHPLRYFHLLRLIFIFLGFLKGENTYWGYFVIVKAALSKCKAKLHYRTLKDKNLEKFFMLELTEQDTVHLHRTKKSVTWEKNRMLKWITDMIAWETRPVAHDEPPPSTLPGQLPCHGKATIGQPPPPVENPDEATKDQQHG